MKLFSKIYKIFIFAFLYLPVFILVFFSFNNSKSRIVWSGFTFAWYIKLFSNKYILSAFLNTVEIATISSIVSTIFGTVSAFGIFSCKSKTKKLILNITNLPMLNPEIVTGISLMILFVYFRNTLGFLKFGMLTVTIAHITFCLPYVILSILQKLNQLDPNFYEAALDLGCTPSKAIFYTILPEILPNISSGILLCFTMSIDDFLISYFTNGNVQTLPILIYSMTQKLVSPEINALSSVMFLIIITLIFVNKKKKS
ncbi:MAG: ABC transporter permease [Candidatus Paraimprobicoccus trichonymphae]|uniref:ABC transporter permease n=1 Tax=Candidatus Paraimprobicoccus trichonymphae TaxID=3033793 RepID=A0AA48I5G9_9FIRM|nr:MAG: ABC transporter permease [Candidatus Paraimprobicoccus trichonymphae]